MLSEVSGQRCGHDLGSLAFPDERPVLIGEEKSWREAPRPAGKDVPRILLSRWRGFESDRCEATCITESSSHVIGIALRRMDVRFEVNGRTMVDGLVLPGMTSVSQPGAAVACVFRGPYDVLHLGIPNALIAECGQDGSARQHTTLPSQVSTAPDPVVHSLAMALLGAERLGVGLAALYADSIGLAIVARLLATSVVAGVEERARVTPLPKWRLKRAMEYIEANLSEPVCLAEMAASTGLTRMHFAAQFRAATGLPPHEYLLRRRIERAQEILVRSPTPVVEVALQVGFQTQAHFTSVFKRFSGFPPHAWRQKQRRAA